MAHSALLRAHHDVYAAVRRWLCKPQEGRGVAQACGTVAPSARLRVPHCTALPSENARRVMLRHVLCGRGEELWYATAFPCGSCLCQRTCQVARVSGVSNCHPLGYAAFLRNTPWEHSFTLCTRDTAPFLWVLGSLVARCSTGQVWRHGVWCAGKCGENVPPATRGSALPRRTHGSVQLGLSPLRAGPLLSSPPCAHLLAACSQP
jgi:hypothetical protein